jgi:hypothetical protein
VCSTKDGTVPAAVLDSVLLGLVGYGGDDIALQRRFEAVWTATHA